MIPRDLLQNPHYLGVEGGRKWETEMKQTWPGFHGRWVKGNRDLLFCSLQCIGMVYSKKFKHEKNGNKYTRSTVPGAEYAL